MDRSNVIIVMVSFTSDQTFYEFQTFNIVNALVFSSGQRKLARTLPTN